MKEWCNSLNIKLEFTVGYFPEANGVAERRNRSLLEKANAMRFEAGLPGSYWEFACVCATYLKNRSPTQGKDITPWEAWSNKRPSVKHYRIFGCPACVQIPKEKRNKLNNKKWKGVFVGYHDDTDRIWKIWDPADCKVKEATSIVFDENFSNGKSEEFLRSWGDTTAEGQRSPKSPASHANDCFRVNQYQQNFPAQEAR